MSFWGRANTIVYRIYYRWRASRITNESKRVGIQLNVNTEDDHPPVLYISWGRIGDAVLATGQLKHLRAAFEDHPVWYLGRPETHIVVKRHVDVFIPFDQDIWTRDKERQGEIADHLGQKFKCIIADIHMFYGGVFSLGVLLERLSVQYKFIYEGYYLGPGLAPYRDYPLGFEVIKKRPSVAESGDVMLRHVSHDFDYYFRTILERCEIGYVPEDTRPELYYEADLEDACAKYDLTPGSFIAWQPISNNPKKDYPLRKWLAVLGEFSELTFVALGTDGSALEGFEAPNVRNLCGRTDLSETLQLIRGAILFIGLDSGLSHISAVLGQKTICVTQSSNLGYFFPYPESYNLTELRTVHNTQYESCSGCFMTCSYESIMTTYRNGALCLRTLPADAIIDNIRDAIHD